MNRNLASLFLLTACACAPSYGQIATLTREQMIKFTETNPYERFPDGRPKVPDALLKKAEGLSAEEVWAVLPGITVPATAPAGGGRGGGGGRGAGFTNQYEGNFHVLHPERKLIGRAVTAQFMPYRPDVASVNEADARAKGLPANNNQRVIDMLQPGDVLVVDLYGKIDGGTLVGDNLAFYIYQNTKAGFVVDGAIRDLDGIFPIPMGAYYRGVHPTPISNTMLTGINVPIRIGNATVMPGDVVFGDREGLYFIPPVAIKPILDHADETHIHDEWTQEMFKNNIGKYKSSDIYGSPRDPKLREEYQQYLKKKLDELHAAENKK
jgi:4-hydroxy-4-methyl-2-oxoglutarate aldolase